MHGSQFQGRLFGPGLPGAGIAASGQWDALGRLRVTPHESGQAERCADRPEIAAAGFNNASLRLSWQQPEGAYALVVDGVDDRSRCAATAPEHCNRQLAAAVRQPDTLERRFRLGWGLLALVLLMPLLGLVLFLLNADRVADWVVDKIPVAQEARLGELVLAQTRLQMKLIDRGPAVEALADIGGRLTEGSVHRYRWFVAERPEVNAFAAPGGVVVVFSGLLTSAATAEELAGVLAHEVAHAELRHSLRGTVKGLGLRALVALLAGDISDNVLTGAATRLTELRFSRDAEREADANGLQRLVAARISPHGMVRFYERLAAEQRPTPPALLSTHPASGERLDWLRREVAALKGPWQPLPINLQRATVSLR
jgi:beta-barrel assembly-enhancing protease